MTPGCDLDLDGSFRPRLLARRLNNCDPSQVNLARSKRKERAKEPNRVGGPMSSTQSKRRLVVTWCSSVKRQQAALDGSRLQHAVQAEVAAKWLELLGQALPTSRADDLYGGRSFGLAKGVAHQLDADLAILSAGLGYVKGNTYVPSYDLTLARGGTLVPRIRGPIDVLAWWKAMLDGPFSAAPTRDFASRPLLLVCLSRTYAPLIASELSSLPLEHVRIFGTSLNGTLSEKLATCVLPYDERLASIGLTGTRSDFAQRALAHYATHVLGRGSLAADRAAVLADMERGRAPKPAPKHLSLDDAGIQRLIERLLPVVGPRRTPMLQHLRRVEGVACEQRRFARLFSEAVVGRS